MSSRSTVVLSLVLVFAASPFVYAGGGNPSANTSAPPAAVNNAASPTPDPEPSPIAVISDPLLRLLVTKGVLTSAEAGTFHGSPAANERHLLELLQQKGILSDTDVRSLHPAGADDPASTTMLIATAPQAAAPKPETPKPAPPKVIPAVAPVRVLPVDPPKREGLIPDIKIGPVRVKPYGFYKTSAVYDSSSPRGDDFPLPEFLNADTGPDANPAFHIKARALRVGTNFEWVDVSPKLTLTGKLEFDFEGNFGRVNNRNISTIRSNAPTIRLGWTRLDYAATDKTSVFALFGQDWTPFASSTLPATIETTGLGIAFGSLYERAPQIRGGFVHNFGGSRTFKLVPEVAVVLPAFGNTPALVDNQLGFGERQGTDSARPEVEARLVGQFQLDPAPGVAPAQLIVSGVQARRDAIVLKSAVPACLTAGCTKIVDGVPVPDPTKFQAAFPAGFKASSERYGVTAEAQLPTRYFTITAKAYRGADLRFFFAGQLFSNFNDTLGLTDTASALSVDASSTVVFGLSGTTPVVAPQRPVRAYGAFGELGLPLSRIFHADPAGRNAGWTMNLHWGFDEVQGSDAKRLNLAASTGQRFRSDWFFGNIQYKLNQWVTFAFEQSLYQTKADGGTGTFGVVKPLPLFEGTPQHVAGDRRSEFATIFTF